MTAETDLLPLPGPDYLMPQGQGWPDIPAWSENTVRQIVAHATATLQAEIEALREALEDIRSRSSMNLAMRPDPFALTARLGDIYQIADAALSKENRND